LQSSCGFGGQTGTKLRRKILLDRLNISTLPSQGCQLKAHEKKLAEKGTSQSQWKPPAQEVEIISYMISNSSVGHKKSVVLLTQQIELIG